jgi:hypothetical protein
LVVKNELKLNNGSKIITYPAYYSTTAGQSGYPTATGTVLSGTQPLVSDTISTPPVGNWLTAEPLTRFGYGALGGGAPGSNGVSGVNGNAPVRHVGAVGGVGGATKDAAGITGGGIIDPSFSANFWATMPIAMIAGGVIPGGVSSAYPVTGSMQTGKILGGTGGGGGAQCAGAAATSGCGGKGGTGGRVVAVFARIITVVGTASIEAPGQNGCDAVTVSPNTRSFSGGGGGGGGFVFVCSTSPQPAGLILSAPGGTGGNGRTAVANDPLFNGSAGSAGGTAYVIG